MEGDYRVALREYREELASGAANREGCRFDPFDDDVRAVLGAIDAMLRGCKYTGHGDLAGHQLEVSSRGVAPLPWPTIMCGVLRARTWRCWRQG